MIRRITGKTVHFALIAALIFMGAATLRAQVHSPAAESGSLSDKEVLERITEAFSGIVSIESGFIQESLTAMLEEPLRSTGIFRYEAPDLVHWEILSPERFGFSSEGDRLMTWRGSGHEKEGAPPGAEAGIRHFMEQLFAWVRADFDWLGERFHISVMSRSPVELGLEPISTAAAERLERIRVTFARDLNHLEAIEISEKGGDRMVITFLNVRVQRD